MSGETTLTLRRPLTQRVDAGMVAWDALRGLEAVAIEAQEVWVDGAGRARLVDVFEVKAAPGERVRLVGDLGRMDGIGAGLAGGTLVVEGDAGWYVGQGMSGGSIEVKGRAGPQVGGALPGAKRGMTGGEIVVRGSAGPGTGSGFAAGSSRSKVTLPRARVARCWPDRSWCSARSAPSPGSGRSAARWWRSAR